MKLIRVFLLFVLITFTSCRPEPLEIDIDPIDPQVVVFSQIFPGELMTVVLTKTLNALDFSQEEGDTLTNANFNDLLLDGASVSIAYGSQENHLEPLSRGVYASIGMPQLVNETYTLKVSTPDGKSLTATSKMLAKADFDFVEPHIDRSATDTLVQVNYSIDDQPGEHWYLLNFYTNNKESNEEKNDLDPLVNSDGSFLKHTSLIEDRFYSNGSIEGSVDLPGVHPTDSLVVTLANVTEEYFRYLEVRKNASNLFTELTKEPVNSPSNVEGGLGFFNMYFPEIYVFDLGEF